MKITHVEPVEVHVAKGSVPNLPKEVTVTLDNGIKAPYPVEWSAIDSVESDIEVSGQIKVNQFKKPFIEQRADPYLYKHTDGYYYFTGSYPLYDRIVLRRSQSLDALPEAEEKVIWEAHESGIMSEHIWAPELHFIDGKWYMHFAAGEKEDVWAIRPYVLECTADNPLEGEWVEKGQVNTEFQSFSLDATTFEINGKRYLVWAQKVENETISNLYIGEMENPWTIKNQVLLSTPEYPWENSVFYVNEGAACIKHGGKVYIAFSGNATDHTYAVGYLVADEGADLTDPTVWTKTKEPVFVTSEETQEYGPGHNSFSKDEDGYDIIVYHARPYKEIKGNSLYDHNRHARIQRLFWQEDGTPFFGTPGDQVEPTDLAATAIIKVKE
ncbi:glycosyl hydrolase [Halolactibacillus miurensis]|uniref:Beta-xylosidase, GH43 family n=1 Tax=Halolactibacillus miurensis TaxID=306541 RepID=A0A1I6UNW1_9BACI|nr:MULTISPECIES: family 43 glycosylhydrolase [Halolactibacillus]GEM05400.1 glycosyl hydrolase [Halolactibacillus miurensis]SFT03121.1 Beta-xylosidase, GH43 family [Halolactibacillus miurensis]